MSQEQRRLAAIMFTDMVGYTALGQNDETLSLTLLEKQRGLVRPILRRHNGTEIKTIGDAFLVEFSSAIDAINCAVEIQSSLKEANSSSALDRRVSLRIGIHIGDVVHQGRDVVGDAVNVASRIEPLSPPGGICVSGQVFQNVVNRVGYAFESLGIPELKNVKAPVEVLLVSGFGDKLASPVIQKAELTKSRVAVLPFSNLSGDPGDDYFADGMTEEVIDRLSQIKQLKVIARTSVMRYKKREAKVSEIARDLGVGSLIDGSIRKAGDKIRFTAQLIDAGTEEHLWSAHFDRTLDDIFAVQSEVAERVAGELQVQLAEAEKRKIGKKLTANTEAYNLYLRGREFFRELTETSVRQAVNLFGNAIDLDHSFAKAYVSLADCHLWLSNIGYEAWGASAQSAEDSLRRALELDPDLPEAHASLSDMLFRKDDSRGAEAEARRAVELNPSLPDSYYLLSELAALKGEPDDMVRFIESAYHLDPIRPLFVMMVGRVYFETGREEEALEHWEKTERLAPAQTYRCVAEYHLSKGDLEMARVFYAKYKELLPTSPWVAWMGGVLAAQGGDRGMALLAIKKIEDEKLGPVGLNYIGYVYHALGDLDSYFRCLEQALESHSLRSSAVMYSPLFLKARADPRYQRLVEKLRRQNGWNP